MNERIKLIVNHLDMGDLGIGVGECTAPTIEDAGHDLNVVVDHGAEGARTMRRDVPHLVHATVVGGRTLHKGTVGHGNNTIGAADRRVEERGRLANQLWAQHPPQHNVARILPQIRHLPHVIVLALHLLVAKEVARVFEARFRVGPRNEDEVESRGRIHIRLRENMAHIIH